jgi:hypothetical protein
VTIAVTGPLTCRNRICVGSVSGPGNAADYAAHAAHGSYDALYDRPAVRLVGPLPAPEMALADPEHDQRLRHEPGFIAFRLVKPPPP